MADGNISTNHEFIVKLEATRWAEFTLWLAFFVFGVPGNLLILAVYRTKRLRTTTHVFIGALATADLLTCVLKFADAISIASVSRYLDYDRQSVVHFLSTGLLYATAFLTTSIAYDRFDAVCRSLRRTMTIRRAKIVAGSCFAAGFIGILPEVGQKIHADIYEQTGKFTFILAVVKFIPVSLYIASFVAVAALYCVIFVFIRNRGRVLVPLPMEQQRAITVSNIGRHQEVWMSTSDRSGSERPTQRNLLSSSSSVGKPPGASASKTSKPASQSSDIRCTGPCSTLARRPVNQTIPAGCSVWSSPSSEGHLFSAVDNVRTCSPEIQTLSTAVHATRTRQSPIQAARALSGAWTNASPPAETTRGNDGPSSFPPRRGDDHRARRQQVAAQSRLTKMLFIATFMFFILWLPYIYLRFYALGSLFDDFTKSHSHANLVAALLVLKNIAFFNSVINAFIYGMANKRFRGECKTVLQNLRQRFR